MFIRCILICLLFVNTIPSKAQLPFQQLSTFEDTLVNIKNTYRTDIGIMYPLGLQQLDNQLQWRVPPITLNLHYGIFKHHSIGLQIGYCGYLTKSVTWTETIANSAILTAAQQLICDTDPQLAADLGIDCNDIQKNGTYYYSVKYLLLGLNYQYHVAKLGKHHLLGTFSAGYKKKYQKTLGVLPETTPLEDLINDEYAVDLNNIDPFYSTLGIGIQFNLGEKLYILPSIGYSYGLGDHIILSQSSINPSFNLGYRW